VRYNSDTHLHWDHLDPAEASHPIDHVDAIAVRDLSKRYATRDGSVAALEGISFGIGEGDYPATKPTGKDEATALRDDTKVLQARAQNWRLEKAGVKRWGESSEANYGAYAEFMLRTGIIKQAVTAQELVTNELIEDINKFDPEKIAAEARAYRAGG
jgi:hypothetical protein